MSTTTGELIRQKQRLDNECENFEKYMNTLVGLSGNSNSTLDSISKIVNPTSKLGKSVLIISKSLSNCSKELVNGLKTVSAVIDDAVKGHTITQSEISASIESLASDLGVGIGESVQFDPDKAFGIDE